MAQRKGSLQGILRDGSLPAPGAALPPVSRCSGQVLCSAARRSLQNWPLWDRPSSAVSQGALVGLRETSDLSANPVRGNLLRKGLLG